MAEDVGNVAAATAPKVRFHGDSGTPFGQRREVGLPSHFINDHQDMIC